MPKKKKTYDLPEDGQDLRLKCVRAIINKNIAQQVGIKHYICKRSAGLGRTLQNRVCDTPQMIMPVNKASSVL